ncbi:sphingomyelin phosphodiesterase [Daldinia caldariorum]|uniref:sphingomyelin phosphodiesterase n=1 Tax=Daldinia caldariorum TaxID=326644 RepID=UPI0020083FCC|nr:sphingomyelin phosphodiesterase [Daldinia caldariorum]KAI1470003.1 sphingomyelin phosphodiesterase [Daldinia caldariorum]
MRLLSSVAAISVVVGRGVTAYFDYSDGSQKVLAPSIAKGFRGGFDPSSIVVSTREDAQSPASCTACEAVLFQLKLIASAGDDFFINSMTKLCQRSGVQDADVCAGSIALEGPIVARSLRGLAIGSRTSRLVCVAFMGLCQHPEVLPYNVSFPSPKRLAGRPRPSGLEPLQVVHFSDIHIDPLYVEGANANCTKPICCREYTNADKPGFNEFPAGPYGEHTCDSPPSLEDSMYAAIQAVAPNAAFAVFTGDIVDHAVWNTSESQNAFDINDAYGRMARAGLRVYGTAGNHEASPANSFPPTPAGDDDSTESNGNGNAAQWLYDLLSATWSRWIGPRAAATTREFGAYSVRHASGGDGAGKLRVISLSTNLYYGHNYWLYEEPMQRDPSGQLAWLVSELDAAEKEGERVYIIGHMPMGSHDAFHDGSNYFDQIVRRYEGTIAAMFFGHTHFDEFEISYADNSNKSHSNALVTSYIAPSMTPISGHPAFRVYTVDPITFGVLDATTYIANVSDPSFSSSSRSGPKWIKYYSAREAYAPLLVGTPETDLEELSPAFWHNVTLALERNETAFAEYFARRRRGWGVGDCDEECRRVEICKLRAARAEDNCVPPGLRLDSNNNNNNEPNNNSEEEGEDEKKDKRRVGWVEDECESSVVRDTLRNTVVDTDMLRLLGELAVIRESL